MHTLFISWMYFLLFILFIIMRKLVILRRRYRNQMRVWINITFTKNTEGQYNFTLSSKY